MADVSRRGRSGTRLNCLLLIAILGFGPAGLSDAPGAEPAWKSPGNARQRSGGDVGLLSEVYEDPVSAWPEAAGIDGGHTDVRSFHDEHVAAAGFWDRLYATAVPQSTEHVAAAGFWDRLYATAVPQSTVHEAAPVWTVSQGQPREWQIMPDGLMYKSYLAGVQEPRFSTAFLYDPNRGWVWDNTLGARMGVLRYGTRGAIMPQGFQMDMEGAAIARLDVENRDDLESVDFRFGIPFTWREGPLAIKFGYYHISSHVGDEFLVRNEVLERINFVRDALILGVSYHLTSNLRAYGETAWAFNADEGARPWEFQFGAEYSPAYSFGVRAAPYAAINGHLRQEHNFGGSLSIMTGVQWRGEESDRVFRFGFQYFNGYTAQYSFFRRHERLYGIGLWYDF